MGRALPGMGGNEGLVDRTDDVRLGDGRNGVVRRTTSFVGSQMLLASLPFVRGHFDAVGECTVIGHRHLLS